MRRVLVAAEPIDLVQTVGPEVRGPYDPTARVVPGEAWRATRTPDGPATVRVRALGERTIEVHAWGAGADRALEDAPALVGIDDDPAMFVAHHPPMRGWLRRFRGLRLGRTGGVMEALIPSILEQKVTSNEAHRAYAALVRRYGERAPGPGELFLPPAPEVLALLPYHAFHPLGIERRRADTIRRACARSGWLEAAAALPIADAYRRLRSIEGVGEWTAAEVARVALGDRDAVSVGDYHLKHQVSYALAGEPRGTDQRMLELLAPYAGQRARAVRLIELGGPQPPRRAPRMAPRSIASI